MQYNYSSAVPFTFALHGSTVKVSKVCTKVGARQTG